MDSPNRFTAEQLREKLRLRNLPTTGLKPALIARLMEVDPEGNWINDEEVDNAVAQDEDQFQLERDRNELFRQELEVTRQARDIARREAQIAQRELKLPNAGILENVPAANRNLDNDLRRHLQQRMDVVAAPQQLRADVKGIGGLLGEFDGTNRYFEDWEKQVRLVKRLLAVDDAIM